MEIVILNITVIVIGLILGSFINVLAYRLPNDMPVILSRSQCPKCNITIPLYRNIPIITYLVQTGKCHNCKQPISLQYPIIEFLTAIVLLLGLNNDWPNNEYILFIWSSCILITISIIDYKTFTIPLKLIMLFLIGELIFMITNPANIENMLLGLFLGLGYLGTTSGAYNFENSVLIDTSADLKQQLLSNKIIVVIYENFQQSFLQSFLL